MKKSIVLGFVVLIMALMSMCVFALGEEKIIDGKDFFDPIGQTRGNGDVNLDNKVDKQDITLLAQCLVTGGKFFTSQQLSNANLHISDSANGKGLINVKDLLFLCGLVNKTENYVIISNSQATLCEDGLYRYVYEFYNPYSRKLSSSAPGNKGFEKAKDLALVKPLNPGTITSIENSFIVEDENKTKEISLDNDLVFIKAFDTESGLMVVVPENNINGETETYIFNHNTPFSIIKYGQKEGLFKWGSKATINNDKLFTSPIKTENLCYNNKIPVGQALNTFYAKYLKAYIVADESTKIVDYGIIFVHGDEEEINLNI